MVRENIYTYIPRFHHYIRIYANLCAEKAAADADDESKRVCAAASGALNSLVSESYALERNIEVETRALQEVAGECAKRASFLKRGLDELEDAVKEMGDVANWAAILQQAAEEAHASAEEIQTRRRQ